MESLLIRNCTSSIRQDYWLIFLYDQFLPKILQRLVAGLWSNRKYSILHTTMAILPNAIFPKIKHLLGTIHGNIDILADIEKFNGARRDDDGTEVQVFVAECIGQVWCIRCVCLINFLPFMVFQLID